MSELEDMVDEAGLGAELDPAVRATMRLQNEVRPDSGLTFRLSEEPIDLTGLRRVEDSEGFGRWVACP